MQIIIIIRSGFSKCRLICLLIIGILVSFTNSYGDEFMIENMYEHHRAKRALNDSSTMVSDVTTQSSVTSSPGAIYIISSYSVAGVTTVATTDTPQSTEDTTVNITTIATTPATSGMFVITNFSTISTTISTGSAISTTIATPIICDNATHVTMSNGTCGLRQLLFNTSLSILYNNSANDIEKANALTTYISAVTNSNITSNESNALTISQMDQIIDNLTATNYTSITNTSVLVITQPTCDSSATIIGASSAQGIYNSSVINTVNYNNVLDSPLSAAGVVNFTAECETVNRFNIFIINDPTVYRSTNSTNITIVSSIIIATLGTIESYNGNLTIQLYFENSTRVNLIETGRYMCAFFDTNSSQWSESGCFMSGYNTNLKRFECHCNHLTSFALIWLPTPAPSKPPSNIGPDYNAQDKASIAFQAISIVCFLAVIIHIVAARIIHPNKYYQTTHLLPIMSCGITMILFIFYIALGLTVYTRHMQLPSTTASPSNNGRVFQHNSEGKYSEIEVSSRAGHDQSPSNLPSSHIPCLPSEHGLMFVVYFLILFMFCTKISIAVDNYRRYVRLFPPLSYRIFIITMGVSFLISAIWLAFAAGFNSNPANQITEVYQYKLCWFNRRVNHYFLTIPVCLFLITSILLCIPVIKHNIVHVHDANEDVVHCTRRKRCIYILLVSCGTQGFGWLFGPVISIASPEAGNVLGWFFIICNGLEGLWALLLYVVVEKEGLDKNRRHAGYLVRQLPVNDNDNDEKDDQKSFQLKIFDMNNKREPLTNVRSDSPRHSFADLPDHEIINRPNSIYHDVF